MHQNKYILIVNPISGDVDKTEIIEKIQLFSLESNIELITFQTTGNDDVLELQNLYNTHKPNRILIVGGDGTIKFAAEALEQFDVIFGIIPAGSSNGLAVDLGLPESLESSLEIAAGSNFMDIDMIEINGKKSIHLSDLGLNASLIKNYENGETRGKLGYALQIITTLVELGDPFSAQIQVNNEIINCEATMIVIANSQKYGTGVTINPNGIMNDGKFEIILLKNLDLVVFTKIVTGNIPENSDDIQIISTDKATIIVNFPVSFQIDGEYIGEESQLDIKILPSQMKIAIPLS